MRQHRLLLLGVLHALLVLTVCVAPSASPAVALLVAAAEISGRRSATERADLLRQEGLGPTVRLVARGSLLAVVAALSGLPLTLLVALIAGVGLLAVSPAVWFALNQRGDLSARHQVRWQGLSVGGVSAGPGAPGVPGFLGSSPARQDDVLDLEWLLTAGLAAAVLWPGDTVGRWAMAGSVAAVVAGVMVFLGSAAVFDLGNRRTPNAVVLQGVAAALADLAPTVVVYFSSPPSGSYALRVWLDSVRRLDERVVVLLREATHLDVLDFSGLPVVVLPTAQDVETVRVPSMRVVLYPTNVVKNNHMIRLPGLRHVFIGHGDSDKAGSFSPVTRVYDEIWVAGEAGRQRYLTAAEGVRPEQIRLVSRPQLAGLSDPAPVRGPGSLPTVLYAPTWEGFYEESDYCSVASPGLPAIRALAASGRVRVLFKPHPATGERRQDAIDAVREIERLLASGPHRRLPDSPEALYAAMREADLLITDVSSVISDWLACRRPYVVTNPLSLPSAELHERFPTTRGGAVLDPDGDVLSLLDDALGPDRLAVCRAELAHFLIGAPRKDPVQDFVDEVSACVRRSCDAGVPSDTSHVRQLELTR